MRKRHAIESLVLMASVAPWGLFGSLGYMAVASPHLLLGLNRFQWRMGRMDADLHGVRELLFSNGLAAHTLQAFADRAQPESALALAELMVPQPWLAWGKAVPPACLVLGAEADRVLPPTDIWATARTWQTEAVFLPDIAHAMMLDYRWESAAQTIHDWLARNALQEAAMSVWQDDKQLAQARAAAQRGDFKTAQSLIETVLTHYAPNAQLVHHCASLLAASPDLHPALQLAQRACHLAPAAVPAWALAGQLNARLELWPQAEAALRPGHKTGTG